MTALDVISTIRNAGGRVVVHNGDLRVVAPPGIVTAEVVAILRQYKSALVGILPDAEREAIQWVEGLDQAEVEVVVAAAIHDWHQITGETQAAAGEVVNADDTPVAPAICRCGSLAWRDVPIHNGRSRRRDCAKCGRFIEFPVWNGRIIVAGVLDAKADNC